MHKTKVLFFLLTFLSSYNIQSQTTDSDRITTIAKNKLLVKTWYEEGWNNNRYEELIPTIFAEGWTDGNPIRADHIDGLEGVQAMAKSYHTAFPDIKFYITHMVADEKTVAVRFEASGTHLGEIFGIKPTGKKISSTAMVFFEIENGKIATTWQEMDLHGLLNQLVRRYAGE